MHTKLFLGGIFRNHSRFASRSFLMGVGVTIGVAGMIASHSLGTSIEDQIRSNVDDIFGPGTIIAVARPNQERGSLAGFELADLRAIDQQLEQVIAWDPGIGHQGEARHRDRSRSVNVAGHSERAETVWNRRVARGRFFSREEYRAADRVAVLGPRIAAALFDSEDPIGEQILVDSIPFRVLGILEAIGIDPHGMDRDENILVPATTVMRRLENTTLVSTAKFVVREPERVQEVADRIESILIERHTIADGVPTGFTLYTSTGAGTAARDANRVLRLYVPASAGVVLAVAALVIASIMTMSVRSRVAEVGVRRAVGATQRQIALQFVLESLVLSLFAATVGMLVAIGIVFVFAGRMDLSPTISLAACAFAFGSAVIVGVIAGLLPAAKAARLEPTAALNST